MWRKLFVNGPNLVIPFRIKIKIIGRKSTHAFDARPMIQEVWEFSAILANWNFPKVNPQTKYLKLGNWSFWLYMSVIVYSNF